MAPSKDAPGRHRPSSRLRNLFVAAGVAAGVPVGIPAATVLGALAGTRRARYLRARRTELGLTQAQAAKAAGVSLRTWQNLESARNKVVAEATLTTAIAALGIPDTVEVPVTTDPDDDTPPAPDAMDTEPPVTVPPFVVDPAATYTCPPLPVLVVPTVRDMDPAAPPDASPVAMDTYPTSPDAVVPDDSSREPEPPLCACRPVATVTSPEPPDVAVPDENTIAPLVPAL